MVLTFFFYVVCRGANLSVLQDLFLKYLELVGACFKCFEFETILFVVDCECCACFDFKNSVVVPDTGDVCFEVVFHYDTVCNLEAGIYEFNCVFGAFKNRFFSDLD